jgi:serine O-acetyltransferase
MSELIYHDAARRYGNKSIKRRHLFKYFFIDREFRVVYLFRKRHHHKTKNHRIAFRLWKILNRFLGTNIYMDEDASIGEGLIINHAFGIAIGLANIGKNCSISQNVTIGHNYSKKNLEGKFEPTIGDNVIISPGAVIVGPVHIGSNVVIGANSVVISDFPDNCIIAGIPARLIGKYDKSRFG